jgi:hypothetical protein
MGEARRRWIVVRGRERDLRNHGAPRAPKRRCDRERTLVKLRTHFELEKGEAAKKNSSQITGRRGSLPDNFVNLKPA